MRDWDGEYKDGRWKGLGRVQEVGHNSIIAGLITYYDKGQFVLDVGCGLCTLEKYLVIDNYHGLDISIAAIQGARPRLPSKLFQGDVNTWEPINNQKYSCIIFNESFYYLSLEEATKVLEKVRTWLEPGGMLIISMWSKDIKNWEALANWKQLTEFYIGTGQDVWWVGVYV